MTRLVLLTLLAIVLATSATVSVDGGDPTSLHEDVPNSPKYDLNQYLSMTVGGEFVIITFIAAVVYILPTRLLTKLARTLFGFEPAMTMLKHRTNGVATHKKDLVPLTDMSIERSNGSFAPDTNNRTRLLSDAPSDDHVLSRSLNSNGHSYGSSSSAALSGYERTALLDGYLHTSPTSVWIMGRRVDFDEGRMQTAIRQSSGENWWSGWELNKACHYLCWTSSSCFTGQCFGRTCCSPEPNDLAFRIRAYIRQLLLWTTYVSTCLFFVLTVLQNTRYKIDADATACPPEVMQVGVQWDCFVFPQAKWLLVFKESYYVDCSKPIPPGLDLVYNNAISCFRFVNPAAETYLSSLSTVGALLTIVFGGGATIFGWTLTQLTTKLQVRCMFAIPIVTLFIWFILVGVNLLHTSLALMAPVAVVVIMTLTIKIRLVIGFDGQEEEQETYDVDQHALFDHSRHVDTEKGIIREQNEHESEKQPTDIL